MEAFIVYEMDGGYVVSHVDEIETIIGSPVVVTERKAVMERMVDWFARDEDEEKS